MTKRVNQVNQVNAVCNERRMQELALLDENCILVDINDKVIGSASKADCHRVDENGHVKLHRSFSVYLFNTNGDMLIQRRSKHKITYPNLFTNTCCSHPLYDIEGEREEKDVLGVRRAARRKLNQELGIPMDQIQLADLTYLMRMHYHDSGNGDWGEHEIIHMLILQKDFDLNPNPSEIAEVRYIKRENFQRDILALPVPLTPWFHLIFKNQLKFWWDNLDNLEKFKDPHTIHHLADHTKLKMKN
ncbi:isopentenyl-diphosphate Delta-isomerase 1-like [Lutzomyia longipalpis]|uniref:isopentenyl-diphosphate Delta-isomerase 1-like n=1 Tax=Lutzomyia longipalpis TaxID=7200 RepID=UPI0024834F18|nr:isopentenyl-diphosphate Delta-isomerase 1-like [Lutzomyia longipalpis]